VVVNYAALSVNKHLSVGKPKLLSDAIRVQLQ